MGRPVSIASVSILASSFKALNPEIVSCRPNVRFRDLALSSLSMATGGTASIVGPLAEPATQGAMEMGSNMTAELLGQVATEGLNKVKFIDGLIVRYYAEFL